MEMVGKSDPYAVVYIRPLFKVKSKVVEDTLNPVWNQSFDLIAEDKETQSLIIEVMYHEFNKEGQMDAFEERKKLKEAGVIGSSMNALDDAASLVGSGVGMVVTGIGAGVGLVGSGIGAGVGMVGSGVGAVGSGLSKAGKFMGRSLTGQSSKSGAADPVKITEENGGAKQH